MDVIQAVQVYAKARAKSVSNQGAISPSSVFYVYPVKTEGICEPCLEDLEKVSSSFESSQIALPSTKYSEKMQIRSHLFGCLFLPFSSLFQQHMLSTQRHGSVKASLPLCLAFQKREQRVLSQNLLQRLGTQDESQNFPENTKYYSIAWALEHAVTGSCALPQHTFSVNLSATFQKLTRLILQPLNLLNTLKQLEKLTNCFKSGSKNSIVLICSKKDLALTNFPLTAKGRATYSPPLPKSTVLMHGQGIRTLKYFTRNTQRDD